MIAEIPPASELGTLGKEALRVKFGLSSEGRNRNGHEPTEANSFMERLAE